MASATDFAHQLSEPSGSGAPTVEAAVLRGCPEAAARGLRWDPLGAAGGRLRIERHGDVC
jgi:hypothetical protein